MEAPPDLRTIPRSDHQRSDHQHIGPQCTAGQRRALAPAAPARPSTPLWLRTSRRSSCGLRRRTTRPTRCVSASWTTASKSSTKVTGGPWSRAAGTSWSATAQSSPSQCPTQPRHQTRPRPLPRPRPRAQPQTPPSPRSRSTSSARTPTPPASSSSPSRTSWRRARSRSGWRSTVGRCSTHGSTASSASLDVWCCATARPSSRRRARSHASPSSRSTWTGRPTKASHSTGSGTPSR